MSQIVNAWHGYTQLAAMTFAFELRDEYGWHTMRNKVRRRDMGHGQA